MSKPAVSYKNHRFPPQIIAHAVWLYFRFPLSLRLVEEMLLDRGIIVSYETIRRWGRKFGPTYAKLVRRKRPSRRDIWHLDEVVISIAGREHWLWREASRQSASSPTNFAPIVRPSVTSCQPSSIEPGLNNWAENSHLPLRKRERMMQGFRSAGGLQRFISIQSAVRNLFVPPHHKRTALATHIHRLQAMAQWKAMTRALA
jgi:putative transposase